MNKSERPDSSKPSLVRKLKNKLKKLTMPKTPRMPKKKNVKKHLDPPLIDMSSTPTLSVTNLPPVPTAPPASMTSLVAVPQIPTVSLPPLPPRPPLPPLPPRSPLSKVPNMPVPNLSSVPESLRVPLANLPSLPESLRVSLANVSSLAKNLKVPLPSISSLPTMSNVEAFLATPVQFVASFLSSCVNNPTQGSEDIASGGTSDQEPRATGPRDRTSIQDFFNFSPSLLSLAAALKLSDLSLLKSLCCSLAKAASMARQDRADQTQCGSRLNRTESDEAFDWKSDVTSDQITQALNYLFANCDGNVKTEMKQKLVELQRKLGEQGNLSDEGLCKICMESPMDCVLLECGHIVSCLKCGYRLLKCPICRQPVVRVKRTFKS